MMHGGGGGFGGGMNRGAGPGMLANVADVDGAIYDPHITRRALGYVKPYRGSVAFEDDHGRDPPSSCSPV